MPAQPLYRLSASARELLRDHPPRFSHPHKQLLFDLAYSPGRVPAGEVEVSRWPAFAPAEIRLDRPLAPEFRPDFYDYVASAGAGGAVSVDWHVNFADPSLFYAYGSRLFAQDEMQVAEHPVLASVREALIARRLVARTEDDDGNPTPVLVRNAERRISIATDPDAAAGRPHGLYGNRLAAHTAHVVRAATRVLDPSSFSNLIAIAAPTGSGRYTAAQILRTFITAFTGFSVAVDESRAFAGPAPSVTIHTGFWGCGAFGGNRHLMVALQSLAAQAAGADRLVVHTGDRPGLDDARRGLAFAADAAAVFGSAANPYLLASYLETLAFRWGTSDGN